MSNTMKVRVKNKNGVVDVKVIINHPMENGLRLNPQSGKKIPAHFINQFRILVNDEEVLVSRCTGGLSKNPFYGFKLSDVKPNDRITVRWSDNTGKSGSEDAVVN